MERILQVRHISVQVDNDHESTDGEESIGKDY